MRVLIDAIGISRIKAGVGVYAKNLLEQLTRISPDSHFYILAQDDDTELDFSSRDNATMIWLPAKLFRKLPLRFLFEQVFLPMLLVKHDIDVLHSLHYSFPLVRSRTKKVVTLHDMTSFSMPEMHGWAKRTYYRSFIRCAVRAADELIFVSYCTRRDFVERFGQSRGAAKVIHLGKSEAFGPGLDPCEIRRVKEKYGLLQPFVFYVGMIEPRKNLPRLAMAFASVRERHPDLLLVIAGKKGWMYDELMETIEKLNLASSVVFTGFVPEADKPFLIAGAKVFAYPTLYEGFGIPVLEALACGVPTLTSNISSIPEVAGDAALTVDPKSIEELSLGLERLLTDEPFREHLRCESLKQARKFTWAKTAAETMNAYSEAFQRR